MMTYFAILSLVSASLFGMMATDDDAWKTFHTRMKAFDTTLDYTQVRMAYAASSEYRPYGLQADKLLERASIAVDAEDFARARVLVDSMFIHQPLHNDAYVAKAWLLDKMGETDSARMYRRITDGLMASLVSSGNGRSAATAMIVISSSEEYAYINTFELTSLHQELKEEGIKRYDLITCRTTDGDTVQLWFNVDIQMKHLAWMLKRKE